MSAIGGIVDFFGGEVDFTTVNTMRGALSLRGRANSTAYFDNGIGVFYNFDGLKDLEACEQPVFSSRKGRQSFLIIDAELLDGRAVMEKYRAFGVETLSLLDAPFSLALYDAERKMLLLARDKKGRKPLFYSIRQGRVAFASEPKGILALDRNGTRVNAEALSAHLTSFSGIYRASDIYTDLSEVLVGECVLITEMGISKFFYKKSISAKQLTAREEAFDKSPVFEPYPELDVLTLPSVLSDILVAFDIPQFDVSSLFIHSAFARAAKRGISAFRFSDSSKHKDISLSYEREDRLSSFFGVRGRGFAVKDGNFEPEKYEEVKEKIYSELLSIFFESTEEELSFFRELFGKSKFDRIFLRLSREKIKKEDTELGIRILGMLCQTREWRKLRGLEIRKSSQRTYCFGE